MCGFAGVLNNSFPIHLQQVKGISTKVSFRGPDNCGLRIYDNDLKSVSYGENAIFFNRLAIIDLDARSDQPFEDDRFTLMFNGEIYNYRELKKELQKEGFVFHTTSDTEVLFYAFQRWGVGALPRLNGMFAICWIDKEKKEFLLARDRMGIKPLYYRREGKSLMFGSELDSILRLSSKLPDIEQKAIHHFLWTQYIPTPYTIVQHVFKLPPGYYLSSNWGELTGEKTIEAKPYWDAYAQIADKKIAASNPSTFEDIMVDSISRQLIADVPLGLFLSSGVDSSLLAALVNKHFAQQQDFNFFTVAFSESTSSDESVDALEYIKGFKNPKLHSHTLSVDSSSLGERLDSLYDYFDEPFGDYASLLNWVISIKAREHVTVAISGDGADELFWGYKRYDQWRNPSLSLFDRINIGERTASVLNSILPGKYMQSKAALELEPDPLHRHFTLFLSPALENLVAQPPWDDNIWAMKEVALIRSREDLPAVLDIKTYLADAMLYKVDRASMAASLEVRVPYLDNTVVDYAFALPFQYKSNNVFKHKAVLKELLQQLAPHYAIDRPKKGFNFPLDKWMRFAWKERVLALVNQDNLSALGLDHNLYLPMVKQYYAGNKKLCIAVWYLLNLALWHQKFKKFSALTRI